MIRAPDIDAVTVAFLSTKEAMDRLSAALREGARAGKAFERAVRRQKRAKAIACQPWLRKRLDRRHQPWPLGQRTCQRQVARKKKRF